MNTLENKAKFFALYWRQFRCRLSESSPLCIVEDRVLKDTTISKFINHFLELTPLSKITDEDAIELAKILDIEHQNKIEDVKEWINDRSGFARIKHKWECLQIFDFLRSKGYALPWMGVSVEQQVEYGWIKLKD